MLRRFLHEEAGQNTVEYVLLAALIAVGLIAAVLFYRGSLQGKFSGMGNTIASSS